MLCKLSVGATLQFLCAISEYILIHSKIQQSKKFKTMIEENSHAFINESNSIMFFGQQFEETVAKLYLI